MSVSLESKLSSVSDNQIVPELNTMLNKAYVRISWYGERLVSIGGYSGEVEINALARKYLQASAFNRDSSSSLEERLECYNLWGRIQGLYKASNQELNSVLFYRYLIPALEAYCRTYAEGPIAVIGEWGSSSTKESLFEFTPEKFKESWPNEEPMTKIVMVSDGCGFERWTASKKMVENVLKKSSV